MLHQNPAFLLSQLLWIVYYYLEKQCFIAKILRQTQVISNRSEICFFMCRCRGALYAPSPFSHGRDAHATGVVKT